MLRMAFPFCSNVVITHLINLQVSFTSFLVNLILGLSASSLVTLQSQLMCCLCKPFPPQKPHILLVLLCITYDHTHLEVDLHPAKTNSMQLEIIVLFRNLDGRIQKLWAFVVWFQAMQGKKRRRLAGLLGEVGDDNIRAEWKCHAEHTGSLQR